MLYFAYGSNMRSARLRERVPSARYFAIGTIKGYKLAFHKRSKKDGSAKADALFTDDDTDSVWGVLFQIDPNQKHILDVAEGLHYGYDEKMVTVETEAGDVTAIMYYATDIDASLQPYSWYVWHVLVGAREHVLPEAYVQEIERVPQIEDPDRERDAKERAVGATPSNNRLTDCPEIAGFARSRPGSGNAKSFEKSRPW
jgi:gamma-glutamylcyclotransferase